MKKVILLIFCVGLIASLRGQPAADRDALNLTSFFGYPLTTGDASINDLWITENRLLPMDVELDSMSRYQIGAIPNQTVWHEGDITAGFYVLTDTLQADDVKLSYTVDFQPTGKITFNEQTGRFKYFPDKFDTRPFTVTFRAEANGNLIVQDVFFSLMPTTPPEYAAFGVEPIKPMPPSTDDYTIVAQTIQKDVQFNNALRDTVRNFSISGKELIFERGNSNSKLHFLNDWQNPDANGWSDIKELNIYAERVIIREALHFPQTNITIYAKELVFEDSDGVTASINTSPEMWDIGDNERGKDGENAGNITLHVKDYKQNRAAKRFILIGGKGQKVYWNTKSPEWLEGAIDTRTPGNGGSGGTLTSTIDVSEFGDFIRGSSGIQIDENGRIIGAGNPGEKNGRFVLHDQEFTWLHPNLVSAVVKHAKDAYLNIHNGFTYNIFSEYTQYIADFKSSVKWRELTKEEEMDLNAAENEMQAVMFRINQNLDYFGNPVGWVPMLSFEVNKLTFEQEIEKAIKVMYLSYWIKSANRTNEERLIGFGEALKEGRDDLAANKELMNQLLELTPKLQDDAADLQLQIEELTVKIERLRQELLAKAKNNVKKQNKLNKIAGGLNIIARIAPVFGSIGTVVGGAVSVGSSIFAKATGASDTYGYGEAVGGFLSTATGFLNGGGFLDISAALNSINTSSIGSTYQSTKDAYNNISNAVAPLVKGVENLHKTFAQSSTPNDQVQAEFKRLMAESKEYRILEAEFVELDIKKQNFMSKFSDMMRGLSATNANIQGNIAAIDGLGRSLFDEHSRHDLRAMQYVDDMERRAKERLLHYHYYMAKAYEYRMLMPYPHNSAGLDLTTMLEKIEEIIAETDSHTLTDENYENLAVIYEAQISSVVETIVDYYNNNRPELSGVIRFSATANDLADLNAGRGFNLNLYERGMVLPNHENARIVNFKIHEIKVRLEGDQNPTHAYFELLMEHSGRSMMRNNGQIYWFDHISNRNENPITWGANYDVRYGIVNEHEPSFASQSLLYSLLENLKQKDNIMIYSRPGAWSDIYVSKNNAASGNTKMVIEDLTFELQYDFAQRPVNNRNLDAYAVDVDNNSVSLSPYIKVSRADKSGRDNGRGDVLYRTYNRGTSVNLEAPAEYGRYKFMNWTDRYGGIVSTDATVSANMSNDLVFNANYKYMEPILSMKDSVLVGKNAQVVTVKVENKGSEEMEWSVVSNDAWIKILSKADGIDTDYITLEIEQNPSTTIRKGYITVTAPETAEYSKELKIVQSNEEVTGIEQTTFQSPKIIRNQGTDSYSVILEEAAQNISTDIYSVGGQLILRKYFYGTSTFDFDLSHCGKGIYLVKIVYDGKPYIQKITK